MTWRMALARLVDSCKLFFDFRLLSAFDSFWRVIIILKEFIFFVLVSTSGASDWQACEDSH